MSEHQHQHQVGSQTYARVHDHEGGDTPHAHVRGGKELAELVFCDVADVPASDSDGVGNTRQHGRTVGRQEENSLPPVKTGNTNALKTGTPDSESVTPEKPGKSLWWGDRA